MIRRLLRDPLAHFLMGGAALWLVLAWRGEDADPASRTIAITRERQAALAVNFDQLMGRAPTNRELAGLVAGDIREEVFYREALRLGLDQDDPVIRRRLSKKMDELASAEAESAEPTDADLRQWLAAHPERFAEETTVSFDQRPFVSESAARAALVNSGERAGQAFDLPPKVIAMPLAELRERFGRQFAEGISAMKPAPGWQGPIPSGYGWHLVRLTGREVGKVPPLETVRQQVIDDWRGSTMQARREAAFRVLRDSYRVTVAK